MDAGTDALLGVIVGFAAVYAVAIGGSVDALGQPRETWDLAGFRRIRWVWQALGIFCLPAVLVYSGLYFVRVRPRLVAASRDLAVERAAARVYLRSDEAAVGPLVDKLKLRIPLTVAAAIALPLVLGYVLGLSLAALSSGFDGLLLWQQLVPWVLSALLVALGNMAFGVTLTPHDLVMRGFIRRHVAWSDVLAITQESTLGSRYVRVWTRPGRSHRLRAPFTQLGTGRRRFETDFAVLEQWWLSRAPAND